METKPRLHKICCPTHPDDIVIRVSLDLKQEKLFYCHECLADYNGSELVKFQDILQALETQYNNNSLEGAQVALPDEMKNTLKTRKDLQNDLSDHISEEKQKVYEEAKKMEIGMNELFNNVRTAIHAHFDSYEEEFRKAFDEFEQSVIFLKQSGGSKPKEQAKQEIINKRIFTSSDTKEAEKNLRDILAEINRYKEVNGDKGIDKVMEKRSSLENVTRSAALIENKGLSFYAEKLKIYQNYLEALLVGFKKNKENENARDKDAEFNFEKGCEELIFVLTELNKQMETSSKEIEKILLGKFSLVGSKRTCTVSEKGMNSVVGAAYRCLTCQNLHRDISSTSYMCEACKDVCHKGHELELVGEIEFVCQCQFKTTLCQLSVCCTFRFTGKTYISQVELMCEVDRMEPGTLLCTYCANNCHAGHPVRRTKIGSAFCDCSILFPFCKYLTEKQKEINFT